jgi:hypothetical protein
MSNMVKKGLSAKDICQIIKECQGTGVSHIKLGDLSIEFHPHRNEAAADSGQNADHGPLVVNELDNNKSLSTMMNDELLEEASVTQLMIDDPLAYEKFQMSKDIERNRQLT